MGLKGHSILRVVSKLVLPYILLFACYVQFHGDLGPGGGFQAGVIFASGLVLYAVVFGLEALRRVAPLRVLQVGGAIGVLIYAGTGVAGILLGGQFLDYGVLDPHDPAHGQHLGIMFVEAGVGLAVASVITAIFLSFAGRRLVR